MSHILTFCFVSSTSNTEMEYIVPTNHSKIKAFFSLYFQFLMLCARLYWNLNISLLQRYSKIFFFFELFFLFRIEYIALNCR